MPTRERAAALKAKRLARGPDEPIHDARVVVQFWAKVDRGNDPDGCWLWTGRRYRRGYGHAWDGTRDRIAHVLAWEIHHDMPVPPETVIRHVVCANPPCVRPDHLAAGSSQDNGLDAARDGKNKGTRHGKAVLTEDDVRAIRAAVAGMNQELAKKYGVTPQHIVNLRARRTWRWLE